MKTLKGPANSIVKGQGGRLFVTNEKGEVVLDVTKDRIKAVEPGVGFGDKAETTEEALEILNDVFGGPE